MRAVLAIVGLVVVGVLIGFGLRLLVPRQRGISA